MITAVWINSTFIIAWYGHSQKKSRLRTFFFGLIPLVVGFFAVSKSEPVSFSKLWYN